MSEPTPYKRTIPDARILYLRPSGASLPLNVRTTELLAEAFPDHEVVTVDVYPLIKTCKRLFLTNLIATIVHYFPDIARRRKTFRHCFWRTPYIFRGLRRLLRSRFGSTPWAFTFQIQSIFDASLNGIPHFVFTDHTHLANLSYPSFDESKLFSRAWIDCEHEIYNHASSVFVMSTNMRRSLIQDYGVPEAHVQCVFSGPNIDVPDRGREPSEADRAGRILFVGVDWRRKGGDVLLEAFEDVRRSFPSAALDFVGCDAPRGIDLPSGVHFHGRVAPKDVHTFYRSASVFCLPTRLEPFGIVFVEAMAFTLPVVATNIGAIPDLIADEVNGFLVDPDDVQGVATMLKRLLREPERAREMGRAGRKRYEQHFNWERTFARIRECIELHLEHETL